MKLSELTKEKNEVKDTTNKREFLKKCIDCASDESIENIQEIGPWLAGALGYGAAKLMDDDQKTNIEEIGPWLAGALGYGAAKIMDDDEDVIKNEVAPPGANYERMVKHLKDKFGSDSPVPYQIAWTKYKNRGKK